MAGFIAFLWKWRSLLIPLGVIAAFGLLMFGCYQKGKWDDRKAAAVEAAKQQAKEELKAVKSQTAADAHAQQTTAANQTKADARERVINAQPDASPSPGTVAFNCERLRQHGTDITKVRACVLFCQAHQAHPVCGHH